MPIIYLMACMDGGEIQDVQAFSSDEARERWRKGLTGDEPYMGLIAFEREVDAPQIRGGAQEKPIKKLPRK